MISESEKEYLELKEILNTYLNEEQINEVDKYYKKGLIIYEGMKRLTLEDYFCHPIRVAKILANFKFDEKTIGCALIHEAITLEKETFESIKEEFDEEVANVANSISKLSNLKRTFKNQNSADKYRRIVVGLSENPITLFIKLADRLDNLRTISVHSAEHIKDIVEETENIFIPIAHRLGIKSMKSEMEDICLKLSDPEGYNEVLEKINSSREELDASLLKMRDELIALLNEHEIKYEITYRVKSVRGIYNKLKSGRKWNNIYDLLGLRILLDKTEECYLVVGLIHSKFRPIPIRFKDFIANPKNNMYQSLHTSVFGVDGRIYEIQIRTYEMNEIAENGVASHWSYKEKTDGSKKSELENTLAQFKSLIEVNDINNNSDFFKQIKTNLTKESIYIFTPKGDIIELPKDATPIDFAYKIHSEIGNTLVGAMVNGKLVSLDYKLQDSDIVDLKTQKGKTPSKSWLKIVKTDNAKSRIRSYFSKKDREESILTGKEVLNNEIKKSKYNISDLLDEKITNELLSDMKVNEIEEIYLGIATLKYTANQILNKLIDIFDPKKDDTILKLLNNEVKNKEAKNSNIIIARQTNILTNLANCCNPVLGDEIVGYITKGNGVSIHRKDCKILDQNSERIIDVSWNLNNLERFNALIKVYIDSSNDNLVDIISVATKCDIIISSINNLGRKQNNDVFELICKVKNKEFLDKFMNELNALKFISKVER